MNAGFEHVTTAKKSASVASGTYYGLEIEARVGMNMVQSCVTECFYPPVMQCSVIRSETSFSVLYIYSSFASTIASAKE